MSLPQNPNFTFLVDRMPHSRICALQGGTRSGKTQSALRCLISYADNYSGLVISVVRESFPALRASALRDFVEILEEVDLYDPINESKPSGYYEYEHNGNIFEFFSVDNQQKVRGRKRDILYINEANEITLEKFRQLAFRTTGRIIIDYNPSDADSYIYDSILTRDDCEYIITTYKDNPHLPIEIINEIELLQDADPEYWKVFGLGERGSVSGAVLGHYKIVLGEQYPTGKGKQVYGLDFGYTAPSALVEVTMYDESNYLRELIYKRKLTNTELIAECDRLGIDKRTPMYCDAAEPDRIKQFQDAGYNAIAADKSIKDGIDAMRSKPLLVHEDSVNLIGELKTYRYKVKKTTGETMEEPVGTDHAIDGSRYAIYSDQKHIPLVKPKARTPRGPAGIQW